MIKWIVKIWTRFVSWLANRVITSLEDENKQLELKITRLEEELARAKYLDGMAKFELNATMDAKVFNWIGKQKQDGIYDVEKIDKIYFKMVEVRHELNLNRKAKDALDNIEIIKKQPDPDKKIKVGLGATFV